MEMDCDETARSAATKTAQRRRKTHLGIGQHFLLPGTEQLPCSCRRCATFSSRLYPVSAEGALDAATFPRNHLNTSRPRKERLKARANVSQEEGDDSVALLERW